MVYVFLADGFEEIEALTPVDIIRRAGIEVQTVGVTGKLVSGAHKITVDCDITIDEATEKDLEAVVLPGGLPGADNLRENSRVRELISYANMNNKYIAAICAAPRILGELGILDGKRAVCYPGYEKYLYGARLAEVRVVSDGKVITAVGMGASLEFALEIVAVLKGTEVSNSIRKGVIA